jgi:hypothetical protein
LLKLRAAIKIASRQINRPVRQNGIVRTLHKPDETAQTSFGKKRAGMKQSRIIIPTPKSGQENYSKNMLNWGNSSAHTGNSPKIPEAKSAFFPKRHHAAEAPRLITTSAGWSKRMN